MNVPFRTMHLFAGAGGGILGDLILGHVPVCAVELEKYPRDVLLQRQRDGILPWFAVWDDVTTFDGKPWRGYVDCICGGFPCQDISAAGKGAGIEGERSGLWSEFARIISEVRPRFAFIENSPMLTIRGLDVVLCDLAKMGYDAEWGVLGADDAGACHRRKRIWILADAVKEGLQGFLEFRQGRWQSRRLTPTDSCFQEGKRTRRCNWWAVEPDVGGMVDGVATELDVHGAVEIGGVGRVATDIQNHRQRINAIGNGQVPATAAAAWKMLLKRIEATSA